MKVEYATTHPRLIPPASLPLRGAALADERRAGKGAVNRRAWRAASASCRVAKNPGRKQACRTRKAIPRGVADSSAHNQGCSGIGSFRRRRSPRPPLCLSLRINNCRSAWRHMRRGKIRRLLPTGRSLKGPVPWAGPQVRSCYGQQSGIGHRPRPGDPSMTSQMPGGSQFMRPVQLPFNAWVMGHVPSASL
eukprot:356592-Chlamydomonas_euryale.AAC.3